MKTPAEKTRRKAKTNLLICLLHKRRKYFLLISFSSRDLSRPHKFPLSLPLHSFSHVSAFFTTTQTLVRSMTIEESALPSSALLPPSDSIACLLSLYSICRSLEGEKTSSEQLILLSRILLMLFHPCSSWRLGEGEANLNWKIYDDREQPKEGAGKKSLNGTRENMDPCKREKGENPHKN